MAFWTQYCYDALYLQGNPYDGVVEAEAVDVVVVWLVEDVELGLVLGVEINFWIIDKKLEKNGWAFWNILKKISL